MIYPTLSVRQPWASALLYGVKDIENRTWPLPAKYANIPMLLHAGKAIPRRGEWSGELFERAMQCGPQLYGGIIGVITFGASVRNHTSLWAGPGLHHWPVLQVRVCDFFPCAGRLSIFSVDIPDVLNVSE